jgi:hypothetical protein
VASRDETRARLTPLLLDVPDRLRQEILQAVDAVGETDGPVGETLRLAADGQLARALTDRSDPLKLLAADALITYVCQVTSEENPNTLATLL